MNDLEERIHNYLKEVRKYVGTPFLHQGRDKNGMDCIGIIVVPLNEVGFFKYDNTNYKRYGLGGEIIQILSKHCYEIDWPNEELKAGDILMFSRQKSQHLAIYTGSTIIHANNFVGKVVEHDLDEKWTNLITKVFRYKEE
jgi:cell wall-associated NlpC family hydrolase